MLFGNRLRFYGMNADTMKFEQRFQSPPIKTLIPVPECPDTQQSDLNTPPVRSDFN